MEVYNRYQHAMFNVAMRITKDTAEAEDVMQESFITAFSKLDSFKGEATFGAWLKRIVINNSLTQYRKSHRYVMVSDKLIANETEEDEAGWEEENYSQLQSRQLLSCMEELHDSYRTILNLHFIEGYDYDELCAILSISYSNCRTLMSRAKESLRKKLAAVTA